MHYAKECGFFGVTLITIRLPRIWLRSRWTGQVLRREDCGVSRRALEFRVDGQRKKGEVIDDMEESGGERKQDGWFENVKCS